MFFNVIFTPLSISAAIFFSNERYYGHFIESAPPSPSPFILSLGERRTRRRR
jgi:hypothetical protein